VSNRIFTLVFAILLLLPGVATLVGAIVPQDSRDLTEGRKLAKPPKLQWMWTGRWSEFTRKADAYANDHFGLRKQLLASNASIRYALRSPASSQVVVGRSGWLFYSPGLVSLDAAKTKTVVGQVVNQAKALEVLARHVESRGGQFIVFVAPDKHTIYPEMLPRWAQGRASTAPYDRMLKELKARGVTTVDVRPTLHATKAEGPLYYRTDTHWTRLAARAAFNDLMKALGRPPVATGGPVPWKETLSKGQDLGRMALMGDGRREFEIGSYPGQRKARMEKISVPNDSRAYRLVRPGTGPTTLVIGDSFTRGSFQGLAMELGPKLVWVHHRRCRFDRDIVESTDAKLVIYEVVERDIGCDRRALSEMLADFPEATGRAAKAAGH
jgi:hypothetical protein